MKKISMLLCLALLVQMLCIPAFATDTETAVPTEAGPTFPESLPSAPVPEVPYGTATISNGCRSLDGLVALGGDAKLLETAQSAFVYELNTGTIIYNYNPDMTLSPGALTKIVTAIVAIEQSDLSDQVTISTTGYTAIAGTLNASLKQGEVMTLDDLLHCLIMRLANDAAVSIAEYVGGTEANFVAMMNGVVQEIGCKDTVFVNCHGMEAAGQHTTARDMARILQYAMRNATFRELFACQSYKIPATNRTEKDRNLVSLNYLMEETAATKFNYEDVTGGLATYASTSGASLACTAEREGLSLLIILMGAKRTYVGNKTSYYGNYEEVWDLLDYGLDNFRVCRLLHDGQSMSQFPVANGENEVVGMSTTDLDAVLPARVNLEDLTLKYSVANGGLTAPIVKDQMVSTLQIWCGDSCVAEAELFAMSGVRSVEDTGLEIQSAASRDDTNLSGVLSFVGMLALIILGVILVYLVVMNIRRSIALRRRRRRRKSRRRSR